MTLTAALALLLCLGAGTIGGVFFAFSTFVMRALGALPPAQGAAAMQRINVVVLNPWFLGVFMGTAALSVAAIVVGIVQWGAASEGWLLVAGVAYLFGTFFVTIVFNVPRNERLKPMDASTPETQKYWAVYLREWTFWNHVRTIAGLAALAGAALSLGTA